MSIYLLLLTCKKNRILHQDMGKSKQFAGKWLTPVSSTAPAVVRPMNSPLPSAPPPLPQPQPSSGGMLDPLSSTIMYMNTNPYFIGMLMLLLNLGGRFLSLELTKKQEAFLQDPWIRPFLFFTVIFIATRNLVAAFWITLLFFFVIWVAANENSPFCMIPSWCGHDIDGAKTKYRNNVEKLFLTQRSS